MLPPPPIAARPARRSPSGANGWSAEGHYLRRVAPLRPDSMPLVWVALAAATGACALGAAPLTLLFAAVVAASVVWRGAVVRGEAHAACWTLLVAIAATAGCWQALAWRVFEREDLGRFAPRDAAPVALDGVALARPEFFRAPPSSPYRAIPASDRWVVRLRAERLRDGAAWRGASGLCEVTVYAVPGEVRPLDVAAGDRLRVFGQLRRPPAPLNPGERDVAAAARAERRLASVSTDSAECLTKLGQAGGWRAAAQRSLDATRARLAAGLDGALSPEVAAVTRGMLLGDVGALEADLVEAFRKTGTLHVLVVSGFNVGLLALLAVWLARRGVLSQRWAILLSVVGAVGYAAVTGASPPAVRAAVVVVAACFAWTAGRRALGINSLAGGAIAVFAASPGAWHSPGTRLSFLATAVLLAVGAFVAWRAARPLSPIERLVVWSRAPVERIARRFLATTLLVLATTAAVLVACGPMIAEEFHWVSPAAVPLSLVLAPVTSLVVPLGLWLATIEGLIGPWSDGLATILGAPAAWVCEPLVSIATAAVRGAAEAPGGALPTAGPPAWWVPLWHVLLGSGGVAGWLAPAWRGVALRATLAVVASAFTPLLVRSLAPGQGVQCSFLAVGHGAATLIVSPSGAAVLCDAGALRDPVQSADTIARVLWAKGVTRLDAVVVSHADVDHFNALPGLLERMAIRAVWVSHRTFPRSAQETDAGAPAALVRLLAERGTPLRGLVTGDVLRVGPPSDDTRLRVLHPTDLGVMGSDNANSLVLGVEHAGRRVLVTGDLETPGLEQVLAQEPYDCDVLVAPHHGSERSDPPGLARWSRPEGVVISSGRPESSVAGAYRLAGAWVANTHDTGGIDVVLNAKGVRSRSWRTGGLAPP
ncbi:MAG: ComEC/Rec2 family competence protein [Lacipirellulaceae bacterium]